MRWKKQTTSKARIDKDHYLFLQFFIAEKLNDYRFKTVAFADTRPKVPNRDEAGAPIKENQARNQRIQMRVERMSLKEQARCNESDALKDMLKGVGDNQS